MVIATDPKRGKAPAGDIFISMSLRWSFGFRDSMTLWNTAFMRQKLCQKKFVLRPSSLSNQSQTTRSLRFVQIGNPL